MFILTFVSNLKRSQQWNKTHQTKADWSKLPMKLNHVTLNV